MEAWPDAAKEKSLLFHEVAQAMKFMIPWGKFRRKRRGWRAES
jgi:hypothetical protein